MDLITDAMSEGGKFVVVEQLDGCEIFCHGIFDDVRTAVGEVMRHVWYLKENYQDDGEVYEHDEFHLARGEAGLVMNVRYRADDWTEAYKTKWYILYA